MMPQSTPNRVYVGFVQHHGTMKTVRIQVETYDGCRTIWYETSRLKEPTEPISKRVQSQLAGLNLKRIEVSLAPATV